MSHVQGRIRVRGDASGEISRSENFPKAQVGSLLEYCRTLVFRRVDLSWNLHGLLRDVSGGEFVSFKAAERALIVLLGREGLTDI